MRFMHQLLLTVLIASSLAPAFALDYVTLREKGKQVTRDGRIIAKDISDNIVLEERDGYWRIIQPKDIIEQWSDDTKFAPYTREEMKTRLKAEFPKEFRILETKRYMIVYDTTGAYATWCGELLEQLDTAFLVHWQAKGFELTEPEFPLVAVIFADRDNFIRCTIGEVGPAVTEISAYYNQQSNRVVFFDLTGQEVYGGRGTTNQRIRAIMSRPESAKLVSTFVHEAVHQICYNSGMLQRYSACPLWVSEGIATLYETPDLRSSKAWSADIKVNQNRLNHFYRFYIERNPREPMKQVVAHDEPFRLADGNGGLLDAYATGWAMMYFFNAQHSDKLVKYLKIISEKQPHVPNDRETRLREFESVFGSDWQRLQLALYQYMGALGK